MASFFNLLLSETTKNQNNFHANLISRMVIIKQVLSILTVLFPASKRQHRMREELGGYFREQTTVSKKNLKVKFKGRYHLEKKE